MAFIWQQACPLHSHNLRVSHFHPSPLETYSLTAPENTRSSKYKVQFQLFYISRTAGNHSQPWKWWWKYLPYFWHVPATFSQARGCPDTSLGPFKPGPKGILSSPGLSQPPERAASSDLRPQVKGLCEPGGTCSLSTAQVKSGSHKHIPGVLCGDTPCHPVVPNSDMPEKKEHLHYSTGKLISKTVHLNKHQASEWQFWLQAYSFYPFSSDCRLTPFILSTQARNTSTKNRDSDLPKAVLPLSTTAASTGILIPTLSTLSIWASAAKLKWKHINHTNNIP